jgi:predicted nucleic acid-binding protein
MATAAVEPLFVDTNILVYSTVVTAPLHAAALQKLEAFEQAGVELWISRQVLREYMATLTRPQTYTMPLPPASVAADVIYFQSAFRIAEDGPAVTANLLTLLRTIPIGGKQVHGANIVATMQAYRMTRLLTHNTADFARFAPLITVIPLVP